MWLLLLTLFAIRQITGSKWRYTYARTTFIRNIRIRHYLHLILLSGWQLPHRLPQHLLSMHAVSLRCIPCPYNCQSLLLLRSSSYGSVLMFGSLIGILLGESSRWHGGGHRAWYHWVKLFFSVVYSRDCCICISFDTRGEIVTPTEFLSNIWAICWISALINFLFF